MGDSLDSRDSLQMYLDQEMAQQAYGDDDQFEAERPERDSIDAGNQDAGNQEEQPPWIEGFMNDFIARGMRRSSEVDPRDERPERGADLLAAHDSSAAHDSGAPGQAPAAGQDPAPAADDDWQDLAADPEIDAMFAKAGGLGEDPRNRDEGGEAARKPQFNNFWGASRDADGKKFGFGRRAANLLWRPLAIAGRLAAQPFRAAYRGLRKKPMSMAGEVQHKRRNDAFEYRWGQFNRFFGINTDRRRQMARANGGEDPGRFSRWGKG